jgi:hypothetical protein
MGQLFNSRPLVVFCLDNVTSQQPAQKIPHHLLPEWFYYFSYFELAANLCCYQPVTIRVLNIKQAVHIIVL